MSDVIHDSDLQAFTIHGHNANTFIGDDKNVTMLFSGGSNNEKVRYFTYPNYPDLTVRYTEIRQLLKSKVSQFAKIRWSPTNNTWVLEVYDSSVTVTPIEDGLDTNYKRFRLDQLSSFHVNDEMFTIELQ